MSDASGRPAGGAYEWFVRGRELHEQGHAAAAAELLTHAAAEEPGARSVREALARALFDAHRYPEAAREFLALTEQAPDDHYAHFGAGLALWRLQRFTAAAEHLTMAVAMRPGRAEYVNAQRQVRATLAARADAGGPPDGPWEDGRSQEGLGADAVGTTAAALCRAHDVLLLDLDGVVYRGEAAVPHAVGSLRECADRGAHLAYVTNNAARPPGEVTAHLQRLGLSAADGDVVTSAQAGARLVRERVGAGARVLAVGGPGVALALREEGLEPVAGEQVEAVAAVMIGFGPDVSWRDLAEAGFAIHAGAMFVATNTDLTIPARRGVAPGNGALVAAVVAATGVTPAVAGKPYPPLLAQTIERTAARRPLVVGDRLDTDIEAAQRLGLPSLLVLTGVTDVADLLTAAPQHRPTYLAADLRGLLAPGREVATGPQAAVGEDGRLTFVAAAATPDPLARLRAAAAACWAAADAGRDVALPDEVVAALRADVRLALGPVGSGSAGPTRS